MANSPRHRPARHRHPLHPNLRHLGNQRRPTPPRPLSLMQDRAVWAPLGIALFLNFAWASKQTTSTPS